MMVSSPPCFALLHKSGVFMPKSSGPGISGTFVNPFDEKVGPPRLFVSKRSANGFKVWWSRADGSRNIEDWKTVPVTVKELVG